ncbi:MAG: hypothetical protein KF830_06855 [Planctomycetes bacterium]|nr:hypothetical protein [Planctomycetota bacterium]
MLHRRFGELPADVTLRVRAGSLADPDRWTDRILDAETLADVFADRPAFADGRTDGPDGAAASRTTNGLELVT